MVGLDCEGLNISLNACCATIKPKEINLWINTSTSTSSSPTPSPSPSLSFSNDQDVGDQGFPGHWTDVKHQPTPLLVDVAVDRALPRLHVWAGMLSRILRESKFSVSQFESDQFRSLTLWMFGLFFFVLFLHAAAWATSFHVPALHALRFASSKDDHARVCLFLWAWDTKGSKAW